MEKLLNYQMYENFIKEIGLNFAMIEGELVVCTYNCKECFFGNDKTCVTKRAEWLYKEVESTKVDWTKVEVDFPIMVSMDGKTWYNEHFAKYKDGKVYTWDGGNTSWSSKGKSSCWLYAMLPE